MRGAGARIQSFLEPMARCLWGRGRSDLRRFIPGNRFSTRFAYTREMAIGGWDLQCLEEWTLGATAGAKDAGQREYVAIAGSGPIRQRLDDRLTIKG